MVGTGHTHTLFYLCPEWSVIEEGKEQVNNYADIELCDWWFAKNFMWIISSDPHSNPWR